MQLAVLSKVQKQLGDNKYCQLANGYQTKYSLLSTSCFKEIARRMTKPISLVIFSLLQCALDFYDIIAGNLL